jgi:hypothetical protein
MTRRRPPLHKRHLFTHGPYKIYAVDPLAVRDMSQGDEEFGNFAVHPEFPRTIPKNEIWITDRIADEEGIFFIANAVAQLRAREQGEDGRAYDIGENVERLLRHRLRGAEFRAGKPHKRVPTRIYVEQYTTLPDPTRPGEDVTVWLIDGALARDFYKTDYTEGGHGYVYRWVPKPEIWVEATLEKPELPYVIAHEFLERRLMHDAGQDYDKAHEICSKVEYCLRECRRPIDILTSGRKLTKADLPRLARDSFYEYVVQHYLKGKRGQRTEDRGQ